MKEQILLGTYTRKSSEGIYQITLDTSSEELTNLRLVVKEDNPTYLALSKKDMLYTVTKDGDKGGTASYQKKADGTFHLLNKVLTKGAPPCYVALDEDRQLVYSANYHDGRLNIYKIQADGQLKQTDEIQHSGSGPHENQASPHVHYTGSTPDGRLVVCDLGTDEVYTYDVTSDGKAIEVSRYKAAPGTGPRHLIFHSNGKTAYLFGELANTLVILDYCQNTGTFTTGQTIATLPNSFTGTNSGAAIRLSPDVKHLYLSNRGHNSIAVCALTNDGKQGEIIQFISSEGDFPRDFQLNPTGNYLVCANQNTDNLSLYKRDAASGKLTLLQKDVSAPECVCVYFAEN